MNRINIIVTIKNSYGGGSIIACTTKDKKILDRCDNLPEFAFNKANSEIFYCLSSKESGLIIQQIRRTYGGRSGSYNVFSLVIPLKYSIKAPILYIFDKVNEIYQTSEGESRNNQLEQLSEQIELKEGLEGDIFSENNKFAYRIFDEELLNNPIQPSYKKFEYILLVDNFDKIRRSSEYEIKGDIIEKKQVYSVSSQVVGGVEFLPDEDCFVCYESELDSKYVTYKADGYVDISKKYGDAITTNDIFIKIPKNSIKIIPSGAEITCKIAKSSDGDFIIIPYNKSRDAKFLICKEGYDPDEIKYEEWENGKEIHLKKQDDGDGRNKKLKLILFVLTLVVLVVVGYFIWEKKEKLGEDIDPSKIQLSIDSTKVKVEEFLSSEAWGNTDITELNGLYLAMNTFSYVDIKKKYASYIDSGYNVGQLDTVIAVIKEYGDQIKKPKTNYSVLKNDSIINMNKWIDAVRKANIPSPSAPRSQNNQSYKCQYCGKNYLSEKEKQDHEKQCYNNPENKQ